MTLQEEDRGRLVDVLGYGKRIERNFSGSAACDRRQFGLAQLSRVDGSSFAIGGRFDEIGHCYLLLFDGRDHPVVYAGGRLGAGWMAYRAPGHASKLATAKIKLGHEGLKQAGTRPQVLSRLGYFRFRKWNTVFFRNPQRLWKTLSWLLPGLAFYPVQIFRPAGVAPMRPFLIPALAAGN